MSSNRWLRGLWITAAGACIALGAGSGVAAADSDASDEGAGSSTTQSAQTSPASTNPVSVGSKDADKGQDSTGGPEDADKPTTTLSASTVKIVREDAEPVKEAELVDAADEPDAKPKKSAKPTASDPVAEPQAERSVEPTPKAATLHDEAATLIAVQPEANTGFKVAAQANLDVEPTLEVKSEAKSEAKVEPVNDVAPQAAAIRSLAAPAASAAPARTNPGPLATVVISLLSAFGLMPTLPPAPVYVVGVPAQPVPGTSLINGVTGVQVGSSSLAIPVGTATYTGAANWYFPTQADGTVQAQGVMLLQHGFLGSNFWYSALAQDLAQRTNSIVVVPNIPSFGFFTCAGCSLSAVPMQQGVAALFADPNRVSLTASASAAGYQGVLPDKFVLTGHSAGGGLATAAGGFYVDSVSLADNDLLGVVMYDGVSSNGTFAAALASLDQRNIPVYQIAAPPQAWNANGQTTNDLVALRPNQFVGDVLVNGSHVDSLIGGSPLIDFVSQLLIKRSPPGNTEAVYTLANGWINDMYAGLGPTDGVYGTYGDPDDYIVLGQAAAVVLGPPPVVDVDQYLGTWYEVGSVRQFFSIGLVNTTAVYTDNGDGTIGVENSGNYFFDNGPESRIFGTAVPLNADNNKLNVTFFGPPSASQPGNYWIVDLAPDYSWAIVSDPNGRTGFLLSRTRTVPDALYQELLGRASVKGVKRWIFPTRQPAAASNMVTV